ncbi:MAG: site-2 protease family protein [Acidiferrobacterales bacterium]
MFESSLQVGRVAGIRIGIHYTWLIIFLLMSSSLYIAFKQEMTGWSDITAMLTAAITSIVFFASIILHELGHSIVAIRNGINVRSITLFIFGGVAQTEKEADRAIVEFKIAIAGPAVSLALAFLFLLLRNLLTAPGSPFFVAFDWLATINLIVAVFNLVPGFPLDGGRVFRALVWGISGDEAKGMHVAVMGGRLVAYGLMAWGLYSTYMTGNFINGIWLVGIGWFLLSAADSSAKAFDTNRIFSRISIRGLMDKDVPRVDVNTNVSEWVSNDVIPSFRRAALVQDNGSVVGLVSLSDTRKVPEAEWASHTLGEIMTPMQKLKWVRIDDFSDTVLRIMERSGVKQVPVVDGDNVVGWIDRDKLIHAISVYVESGEFRRG